MKFCKIRAGVVAPPLLLAAVMGGHAQAAQSPACVDALARFEAAVTTRPATAATRKAASAGLTAVASEPGCRTVDGEKARAKLVDFLIDYAVAVPAEAKDTIAAAQNLVLVTENWRGKARLGDWFAARKERLQAVDWYRRASGDLAIADPRPTAREAQELANKLGGEQLLAGNDHEGAQRGLDLPAVRDLGGTLGGIYGGGFQSRSAERIEVPWNVQFITGTTEPTELGKKALAEMVEFAGKLNDAAEVTFVGHADPRAPQGQDADGYNMELSCRRVVAVRELLRSKGVKARIQVDWKGKREPFPWQSLPEASSLSDDDKLQLDRRVAVFWYADEAPAGHGREPGQGRTLCRGG
jgi:outer membrane protein OmpA-like peptidoglycan-associated protein